jgi:hypothetical protein
MVSVLVCDGPWRLCWDGLWRLCWCEMPMAPMLVWDGLWRLCWRGPEMASMLTGPVYGAYAGAEGLAALMLAWSGLWRLCWCGLAYGVWCGIEAVIPLYSTSWCIITHLPKGGGLHFTHPVLRVRAVGQGGAPE